MALRFTMPIAQWVSSLGVPLAGAKLYFYASGTSTPLDTYSDAALTVPNTNPVVADSTGVWGSIYLQAADYKVNLTTSTGAQVAGFSIDPVSGGVSSFPVLATGGVLSGTLQDRFGDFLSMGTDFALTDAGFAAAITACGSTKVLYIPAGRTVSLTSAPTLVSGLRIQGRGTISASIAAANTLFDLTSLTGVEFDGPTITCTGNAQTAYTQTIFLCNTTTLCKVKNCTITGTNRNAFVFSGVGAAASTDIDIDKNKITVSGSGTYSMGIYCNARTDTVSITTAGNRVRIRDNDISGQVQDILFDGDDSTISGNHLHGAGVGFGSQKLKNSIITNNNVHDKTGQGIAVGNGTGDLALGVTVSNNVVRACYQGINIYAQPVANANFELNRAISIVGNICHANTNNGIFAYGNGHLTITGNSCYGNSGGGIDVETGDVTAASAGHISVTGNYCYNNSGAGLAVVGPSGALLTPYVTVNGNVSTGNGGRGIYIAAVTNCTISANISNANTSYGINSTGNTNALYSGNVSNGNTANDFQLSADTGTVLMGNFFTTSNISTADSSLTSEGCCAAFGNRGLLNSIIVFGGSAQVEAIGQGVNFGARVGAFKIGNVAVVAP